MQSGGLRLDYLPQSELASGRLTGLKSLFHWKHPEMGRLMPNAFLAAADECGMLASVSRWQLEEVCRELHSWLEQGLSCVPVTIPLTSRQLLHPDFFPMLERALSRYAVGPGLLIVELQERAVANATTQALDLLTRIGGLGLGLAVDNFGVDRCPLARLQQIPVRRLAVNRELLASVPRDREAGTLVAAVIALGHALGLTVLADGVEREDQLNFLRAHSCDQIQGPLCAPALSGEKTTLVLRSSAKGS
jgi:EAL domain-containing protein (putative c-di-GMP-specific phosphodiesterase class I)